MKNILLLFAIIFTLSSCEKLIFNEDKASSDPMTNFNYLWNEVDKKYSYFELKHINWDSIKTVYQSKITSDMSEEQLFVVLADMMKELRDDHTNLYSPFNKSKYNVALHNKPNFNQRTIDEMFPNIRTTGSFENDLVPGSNIAYIRYSSFMDPITNEDLDNILNYYKDTKGMILDLRANGGGATAYIPIILERFTSEKRLVGYMKTRNGPNHDDFSDPENFYIGTHDGVKYNKPLVVLIDRGSFSATTMFSVAAKALPNITLIGDTTGGGGGAPNGGQMPNGWIYRFSVSQLLDLNMKNYAENGVPPTIVVDFDWSDLSRDKIIERAVIELNKN